MAGPLPSITTTVLSVPNYRKYAHPIVQMPDAVLDASMRDPSNNPPWRIRPGNVIVKSSQLGRFVAANDPAGDRNLPALVVALENASAAWNGLAINFTLNGGVTFTVALGAQTATEAQAVADLQASPVFAANLVADVQNGLLRIRTLRAGQDQILAITAPTRPQAFGVAGSSAIGTDADYRVTEGEFVDLQSLAMGAPVQAFMTTSNVGAYIAANLLNNTLTPEARAVLTRRGAQFF